MDNKSRKGSSFSFSVTEDQYKTSSYTHPGGVITRCVEVAIVSEGVAVRDTKDRNSGTLYFRHDEWDAFIKGVKEGQFDN